METMLWCCDAAGQGCCRTHCDASPRPHINSTSHWGSPGAASVRNLQRWFITLHFDLRDIQDGPSQLDGREEDTGKTNTTWCPPAAGADCHGFLMGLRGMCASENQ